MPLQRARPNFRISRFLRFPHFPETGLAKSAFFQKIKAAEIMPFITPRPQARKKSGFATPSKQVPLGKWASNRGFAAGRSWDGTRAQASSGRVRQAAGAPAAGPGPEWIPDPAGHTTGTHSADFAKNGRICPPNLDLYEKLARFEEIYQGFTKQLDGQVIFAQFREIPGNRQIGPRI